MNIAQENFVLKLAEATKNHSDWLAVVKFGLPRLLEEENQELLFELVSRQASVIVQRRPGMITADAIVQIFSELKLKLVLMNRD